MGALYGQLTWMVPRTYNSYGDKTFAAAWPRLWNSLSVQLYCEDIMYGRQLKGHLFGNHGHGALWLLICNALEKNIYLLTYILTDYRVYNQSVVSLTTSNWSAAVNCLLISLWDTSISSICDGVINDGTPQEGVFGFSSAHNTRDITFTINEWMDGWINKWMNEWMNK